METITANINWGIVLPLIVIQLVLMAVALIDCLRAARTKGPKWMWVLLILFVQIVGPVLYFTIGKERDA